MLNPINVKYWELIHGSNKGTFKDNDYSAKCDICGDSSHGNKKRLHLYRKDSYSDDSIKCFNCGYTSTVKNYIKNYHSEFFVSYRAETNESILSTLSNINSSGTLVSSNIIQSIQNMQNISSKRKDEGAPNTLFDISLNKVSTKTGDHYSYIKSRGLSDGDILNFYACFDEVKTPSGVIPLKDYIVHPLLYKDRLYGFYARSIHFKSFYMYMPEENVNMKTLWWYDINKLEPVYIFEGLFDAYSSGKQNKLCLMGAELPEDKEKKLKHRVWCLDNDKTGIETAIKKVTQGDSVLVYPENFKYKDINAMLVNENMTYSQASEWIDNHIERGLSATIKLKLRL